MLAGKYCLQAWSAVERAVTFLGYDGSSYASYPWLVTRIDQAGNRRVRDANMRIQKKVVSAVESAGKALDSAYHPSFGRNHSRKAVVVP